MPALVFSASFLAVANLEFPRCLLICGCGRRVTMAINSKRFTPGSVCPFTAGRAPGVEAQTRSAFASSRRPSEQLECSKFSVWCLPACLAQQRRRRHPILRLRVLVDLYVWLGSDVRGLICRAEFSVSLLFDASGTCWHRSNLILLPLCLLIGWRSAQMCSPPSASFASQSAPPRASTPRAPATTTWRHYPFRAQHETRAVWRARRAAAQMLIGCLTRDERRP